MNDTRTSGTVTLMLGSLFLAATAWTYLLSLADGVNPPTGVRAVGLVWLPIGLAGVPIAYDRARRGTGRGRARVGVALGLVGLVAFVALVVAIG